MKSKYGIFLVLVLVVCAVFLSSCSRSAEASDNIVLHASWAEYYENINDLTSESDFIALVEIKDVVSVMQDENGIYFSVFRADVLEGVLGKDESIDLLLTGAAVEDMKMEIEDDPLLKIGEKWLVFARMNDSGTYTIIGGPCGRFAYNEQSNTVTSLLRMVYDDVESFNASSERGELLSTVSIENFNFDELVESINAEISKG